MASTQPEWLEIREFAIQNMRAWQLNHRLLKQIPMQTKAMPYLASNSVGFQEIYKSCFFAGPHIYSWALVPFHSLVMVGDRSVAKRILPPIGICCPILLLVDVAHGDVALDCIAHGDVALDCIAHGDVAHECKIAKLKAVVRG